LLIDSNLVVNGATGSRLISKSQLYENAEDYIAQFHVADAALLFNSGYDANVGFFGVYHKGDLILDELCHASIRDGIKLSKAQKYACS
jgi:8-amino-7-oxononanoate synthase